MECNKDEATRAMSIAESKLEQKDFIGAKKFALKAQTLYPGLYGISHMLTALDVYLAAENRLSGEVDWYGVLGVNPSADDGTIKKQYRKLALLLHPDKNNSVGADGAFKLISEAWSLLADKEKRTAYNQRKGFHQKVTTRPGGPSAPCRPQQHNVPAYAAGQSVPPRPSQQKVPSAPPRRSQKKAPSAPLNPSQQKVPRPSQQNRNAKVPRAPNPSPFHLRSDTFWTACRGCNIYFEYLKIYCNHTLLCHICQRPFLGLETALPVSSSKSAKPVPWLGKKSSLKNLASHQKPKRNAAAAQAPGAGAGQTSCNSFTYVTYQEVPFPGTANTDSSRYPSTAGNVVQQQVHDNLKRSHTESHASAGLEGCYKKVKLDSDSNRYGVNSHYMADGNGDFGSESGFGAGIYGCS